MKNPLKSQQGMIDMILIAVIAVAAIGLGGYYIYQQNQTKKAEQAAGNGVIVATHKKASTPTNNTNEGYLVITNWKVKGPWTNSAQINYVAGNNANVMELSSPEITALSPSCKSSQNAGILTRYSKGQKYGTLNQLIETSTAATKVGDYYYLYESGSAVCFQDQPTANATQYNQIIADLKLFQEKLQAVQ